MRSSTHSTASARRRNPDTVFTARDQLGGQQVKAFIPGECVGLRIPNKNAAQERRTDYKQRHNFPSSHPVRRLILGGRAAILARGLRWWKRQSDVGSFDHEIAYCEAQN